MRPRPAFVSVLLVSMLLTAGCFGVGGSDAPETVEPADNETDSGSNATLPDGRGESLGNLETNKTEEGVGGSEHKHDYWQGREQVVVFQRDVGFSWFPVYPDGEGSSARSVAYLKLPQPNLVFEGTTSVEVLVQDPRVAVVKGDANPAHPSPPSLSLTYRTASTDDFVDAGAVTYGTPLVIPVTAKETDMPHSVSSLWAFRLATDKSEPLGSANVTITIKKGANVVDWPGHPDFYAEKSQRVVLDEHVKVHRSGIDEYVLYGSGSSWIQPKLLISHGTEYVDVWVNVTGASSSNGAEPTGFFLEYHNATILHAEDDYNDRIDDEDKGRQFDHNDYHFVVPVDHAGMDGPYQPSSRWGFRMVATFAETPAFSLCPGCFAYDVEFQITIVAHGESTGGMD